jgi:hypothetical protein
MTPDARPSTASRRPEGATVTRLVPVQRRSTAYAVQGALALDVDRSTGIPETPELDPTRQSRAVDVTDTEVRAWASRLAQAVVETVGGQRPVSQLVRWTAPEVYRELERRTRVLARAVGPGQRSVRPQVRSVHVCRLAPEVAEVSVHVRHAARSRAVAMRLEQRGERWLCTVLQFG